MHTFHICNYNYTFTKSIPFLKVFISLHIKFCGQKSLDMMTFPLKYPNESFYLTALLTEGIPYQKSYIKVTKLL